MKLTWEEMTKLLQDLGIQCRLEASGKSIAFGSKADSDKAMALLRRDDVEIVNGK